MTDLTEIALEIIDLELSLSLYLTMVSSARLQEGDGQRTGKNVPELAARVQDNCSLLGIKADLKVMFQSSQEVVDYILSFPENVHKPIISQLFRIHGRRARDLYHFVQGLSTLVSMVETEVEVDMPDAREVVFSHLRDLGRSLEIPDNLVDQWIEIALGGFKNAFDLGQNLKDYFQGNHQNQGRNMLPFPSRYDVFLSYAEGDSHLADRVRISLEAKGLQCFMAKKSINVAKVWEEEIRTALTSARFVLLLITPRSKRRPWILLEAGAAWVLNKEIIPLLILVPADKVWDPIRKFQARTVETEEQCENLAAEIAAQI
jgi:hypothetical protein